uniref:Uncharacterized protein n=1 Tax=Caenorhabditis japonica TaxID=281687 RepID=A0A8R1EIC6_CAEJA
MPCKQPIGPEDGIRDQVWLGQATSRSRRKETERGGNTSRGNLLGPRSSAEARVTPILLHTGACRVRHHSLPGPDVPRSDQHKQLNEFQQIKDPKSSESATSA